MIGSNRKTNIFHVEKRRGMILQHIFIGAKLKEITIKGIVTEG